MIYISHTGVWFGSHCSMRGEERRGGILGKRNWGDREKGLERECVCVCECVCVRFFIFNFFRDFQRVHYRLRHGIYSGNSNESYHRAKKGVLPFLLHFSVLKFFSSTLQRFFFTLYIHSLFYFQLFSIYFNHFIFKLKLI